MSNSFNDLSGSTSPVANQLAMALLDVGVDFSSGVPCGVLRRIISFLIEDERIRHVIVNRESEAVGVAVGAYLAGRTPVVYMQNSGLFTVLNDVSSLLMPYEVPILNIVSFRGCNGEDAPQHIVNGRITVHLLKDLGLPYCVFSSESSIYNATVELCDDMRAKGLPGVLLLERGWDQPCIVEKQ